MTLSDLRSRLASRRLFHAYIVTGGSPDSRLAAGKLIARAAVCSGEGDAPCGMCRDCRKALRDVHPDIEIAEKTAREYSVDEMRALRARSGVLPNEAPRSVYVITDADDMNPQAQNAMLKVFEEPPSHAVFVLLAGNPQRLLQTVRSRCETVNLTPEEEPSGELRPTASALADAFRLRDDLALVRALRPVEKLGRNELPQLIEELRRAAVSMSGSVSGEDMDNFTKTLDEAAAMAAVNVSAGHICALMLARFVNMVIPLPKPTTRL